MTDDLRNEIAEALASNNLLDEASIEHTLDAVMGLLQSEIEVETEMLRIRAAWADSRADLLSRRIARVRQMADAWERDLPDIIRTATAAQAVRDATEEGT